MKVSRVRILFFASALAAICVLAAALLLRARGQAHPNIVLVVIDTLRADHLSCYGYRKETSPFISELASKGLLFERAYSASSWTSPGTASIHTSLYPFQHGVTSGLLATRRGQKADPTITLNRMPEEAVTIAEVLRNAGYRTFAVTDNINITVEQGFDQGFDEFQNYDDETAEAVNRKLEEWRDDIRKSRPYFLYLHYNDPHEPYHRRRPWFGEEGSRPITRATAYDSEIGYVDSKIREAFHLLGWGRNTVVLLTSDHGEEFYEHGELGHGKNLYSETVHVPLLIYPAPGSMPGSRIETPVGTVDVLPTIRDLAGLPPDSNDEGVSLIRTSGEDSLLGEGRFLLSHLLKRWEERGPESELGSVISGGWKYIIATPGEEELYNLADDPKEKRNVIEAHRDAAELMRGHLEAFATTCRRLPQADLTVPVDEKLLKRLESLGYVR